MWLAGLVLRGSLAVGQASAPLPSSPALRHFPASIVPVARKAAADADAHAHSPDELTRSLARIERAANVVQQHQTNATLEAQAAARTASSLAPKLARAAPPGVDPAELVGAVEAMSIAARQGYSPQEIRARALQVIYEVHRYYDAED
jgi:hypothetical protein